METQKPRIPEVGEFVRGQGVLINVNKIQPPMPEPIIEYVFEERSARKELRFKDGSILQRLETLNDFYGLGSGEKLAIKEMIKYCKNRGIDRYSDVEGFVVREVDHTIKEPNRKPNFYDETVVDFDVKQDRYYPLKHQEIDVWSSKKGVLGGKHDEFGFRD